MQTRTKVSEAIWTAFDNMTTAFIRRIKHSLKISWKRAEDETTFAIVGTSLVDGIHLVKGISGALTSLDSYQYVDETNRVVSITYDRVLNEPLGGISQAVLDVVLDNHDNRFTPEQNTTIGTALIPRRPISAQIGFLVQSQTKTIPVFKGLTLQPKIDESRKTMKLSCVDLVGYLYNIPMQSALYTDQRTDEIIEDILNELGFGSSQYSLDVGNNTIGFAWFEKNVSAGARIQKLCESEEAIFYADEDGILRFENRDHYAVSPYNADVWDIDRDDIIVWEQDDSSPIYNTVGVKAKPRAVQSSQDVWIDAQEEEVDGNLNATATNYYRFEGNADATTGGVNGTDTDVTYGEANGKYGEGALFNGSSSKISLNNTVMQVTTGDFTVGLWVKNLNTDGDYHVIVSKGSSGANGWGLAIRYGAVRLLLDDGTNSGYTFDGSSAISDGNWHHIAVSVDRDVGAYFYLDGSYVSFQDCTARSGSLTTTATTHIGSYSNGTQWWLDATIDEFVFFNSALNSTQVAGLYAGMTPVTIWANLDDPATAITTPASGTDYTAFTGSGGTGSNISSDQTVSITSFYTAVLISLSNANSSKAYYNLLKLRGTPATVVGEILELAEDTNSIDKYDEQKLDVENDFIDSRSFANSLAESLVSKYAEPTYKINLTIQGIPQLQLRDWVRVEDPLGTLRNYRVMRIQGTLQNGFFSQKLSLREITANE